MDYDEKEFQARANRIARGMWIAMVTVLSLVYGMKAAKGQTSPLYYSILLALGWIPLITGIVILKIKGGN